MNAKPVGIVVIFLVFFASAQVGLYVAEEANANPFPTSPIISIESPQNMTYATTSLPLNLTLVTQWDGLYFTSENRLVTYSLDEKASIMISPSQYRYDSEMRASLWTGSAGLANLTDGSHSLRVTAIYRYDNGRQVFTSNSKVSFTIDPNSKSGGVPQASGNPWTPCPLLPTAITGLKAAVADGKIYAFKGSITYESNPGTMWVSRSSMPTSRTDVAAATYQNKVYVIGGRTNDSTMVGTNQVYDPANDSWKTLASMPTAQYGSDANVVDGKIYLIGGLVPHHLYPDDKTTAEATNLSQVYDPATDSWIVKSPVPNAVHNYASAVMNNKIYIISETLTQIYDPHNDNWSYGAPPPHSVDMAGCAATSGDVVPERIYVIGGRESGLEVNYNQVYDPAVDSWSLGAPMPTGRYSLGVAAVNDVIYAFGGMTGAFVVIEQKNQVEKYSPIEDSLTPVATPFATPTPLLTPTLSPTPNLTTALNPTSSSSPPVTVKSPTQQTTETPTSTQPIISPSTDNRMASNASLILIEIVAIVAAAVATLAYFKKRKTSK